MLMDDYSSMLLYNKRQNTMQSLMFFMDRKVAMHENKNQDQYNMMSLLNQCSVLSKDILIAPLCSVTVSAISTSWTTSRPCCVCNIHVLGTGTLSVWTNGFNPSTWLEL